MLYYILYYTHTHTRARARACAFKNHVFSVIIEITFSFQFSKLQKRSNLAQTNVIFLKD